MTPVATTQTVPDSARQWPTVADSAPTAPPRQCPDSAPTVPLTAPRQCPDSSPTAPRQLPDSSPTAQGTVPRQCPDSAPTVADSEPDSADSARQSDSQGSTLCLIEYFTLFFGSEEQVRHCYFHATPLKECYDSESLIQVSHSQTEARFSSRADIT